MADHVGDHGHHKLPTFIGCLHEGGLVAPYVLDGAVNAELFVADTEQQVVPSLTHDTLWQAVGRISRSLTREECVDYPRHGGYVQPA